MCAINPQRGHLAFGLRAPLPRETGKIGISRSAQHGSVSGIFQARACVRRMIGSNKDSSKSEIKGK
jgi:hypothetical protein